MDEGGFFDRVRNGDVVFVFNVTYSNIILPKGFDVRPKGFPTFGAFIRAFFKNIIYILVMGLSTGPLGKFFDFSVFTPNFF